MGLEIKFDNHQVRKHPLLGKKKLILSSGHIVYFSKGLTPDFGQKLEITPWIAFGKKKCLEIMCVDFLVRKQALLDYKKADFTKWPYWMFFKGVNP